MEGEIATASCPVSLLIVMLVDASVEHGSGEFAAARSIFKVVVLSYAPTGD